MLKNHRVRFVYAADLSAFEFECTSQSLTDSEINTELLGVSQCKNLLKTSIIFASLLVCCKSFHFHCCTQCTFDLHNCS